ncbi:MAG: hypothetical protein ACE10C_13805, partial [Candidatus Binatia bacterium]
VKNKLTKRDLSRSRTGEFINRRFTQIFADKESEISPQRRKVRRELVSCLSGDDDKQKLVSIADDDRIFNWR